MVTLNDTLFRELFEKAEKVSWTVSAIAAKLKFDRG